MFDTIAPRYDLVNRIMTLRMDVGWRKRAVRALALGPGAAVVDLACGTGDLCATLAHAGYRAVGIDMSLGMLRHAHVRDPLVQGDGLRLPLADASVEGAVSGFALRNFVSLTPVFEELARVVRPGGRVALLDVSTPPNPIMRLGHSVYFGHVVPQIGGLLSDRAAYRYLPQSVAYLPPTSELLDLVGASGWGTVRHQLLSGGIAQLITATRPL
jgi:demethylmenaquinone methyltransferase/2-methoxy-6-polyprenyl-1,4-benzoquinol methylase